MAFARKKLRGSKYYAWLASNVGKCAEMSSHNQRIRLHSAFVPWCDCAVKVVYPNYCSACYIKFLRRIRQEYLRLYRRFEPYFHDSLHEIAKQIDNCTF